MNELIKAGQEPVAPVQRFALNPDNGFMYESARGPWCLHKDAAPQLATALKDAEIAALTDERDNALALWTVAHAERSAEMMRGAEQEVEIAALRAELARVVQP